MAIRSHARPFVIAPVRVVRHVLSVPVGYLGVLTGAAWVATVVGRSPGRRETPTTRFAVLVPAHDEEQVIGEMLRALAQLEYPTDRYQVHVVADHCTDRTVEIARSAGATVHQHDRAERGKGPALEWVVDRLMTSPHAGEIEAFVVVDADTIVDPLLLLELDRSLRGGAEVVQGQYRVRDPGSSASAGLRAAALALRHHLRPLGRTALGASSGLYGNGMAFSAATLRGRTWSNHLTEDLELQMELLLEGTTVAYAPRAVVEAEMPATLAGAKTQNERWERGRLDLLRRYLPQLVRSAWTSRRRRLAAVDGVLDLLVPPLSVLTAAVGAISAAELAISLGRRNSGWRAAVVLPALLAWHVASGLVLARAPASVYRSLLHAPSMVAWKVGLWLRMVTGRGPVGWVRTARMETGGR